jgi:cobalt transporter subunit CbtA
MHSFRAIVFTSVLVGLIAGMAVSAIQFIGTAPLILKAEVYEKADEQAHPAQGGLAASHEHEQRTWEPAGGFERNVYSVAANILTSIGYALVLTGFIALRGKPITWREGLLWGMAGFICVMLAPMPGLPPELPGTPSAPVGERQIWWIATVAATAAALGLLAFQRKPWATVLAIVLIAAPHLVGAPAAPVSVPALAPQGLELQFVAAGMVTSLIFWAVLGSLSGAFLRRLTA